jgi:hypothetical protein
MNIQINSKLTRRHLINCGVFTAPILPVAGLFASSGAVGQGAAVDPNDPTAKALGFVTASATPNQKCNGFAQFQGKTGDAQRHCTVFAGKTVPAGGWCKCWSKKRPERQTRPGREGRER